MLKMSKKLQGKSNKSKEVVRDL